MPNILKMQDYTAIHDVVNQKNNLLTPYEVSKLIKVSPGTLAVWRATKRYNIPYVKIGGKVLYPENSLYSWIETRAIR